MERMSSKQAGDIQVGQRKEDCSAYNMIGLSERIALRNDENSERNSHTKIDLHVPGIDRF